MLRPGEFELWELLLEEEEETSNRPKTMEVSWQRCKRCLRWRGSVWSGPLERWDLRMPILRCTRKTTYAWTMFVSCDNSHIYDADDTHIGCADKGTKTEEGGGVQ